MKFKKCYLTLAVSGAHVRAKWLHHPYRLGRTQMLGAGMKIRNGYLTPAVSGAHVSAKWLHLPCCLKRWEWLPHPYHFGGTCVGEVATSPVLSRASQNAQCGDKIKKWLPHPCRLGGPRLGKLLEILWLERVFGGKDCWWEIWGNNQQTLPLSPLSPYFPLIPHPFFFVAKWGEMEIARPSHDIQQKVHFGGFWPENFPFPSKPPPKVPFPSHPLPLSCLFPISKTTGLQPGASWLWATQPCYLGGHISYLLRGPQRSAWTKSGI